MSILNLIISPFVAQSHKSYLSGQKQVFYSLYEFALRISCRYTGFKSDPELPVYEGFLNLFHSIEKNAIEIIPSFVIRRKLKVILIDTCLEIGRSEPQAENDFYEELLCCKKNYTCPLQPLSAKNIIDSLRMLPFPYRSVFNLSVMDRFSLQAISQKLHLPIDEVKADLEKARILLRTLIVLKES